MTNPVPNTPSNSSSTQRTSSSSSITSPVKIATPDIVLFNEESIPIEAMVDLIFENIGGQEILSVSRNDTINGQNIIYAPIKNLLSLKYYNNPENILAFSETSDVYFNSFSISLLSHIPEVGTGPNNEIVYLEDVSGNLIVNVINMLPGEQVEVQILDSGTIFDDTIYEEEES